LFVVFCCGSLDLVVRKGGGGVMKSWGGGWGQSMLVHVI